MELLKHTIQWCKGEIFEGKMVLLFGFLFLTISFCFWKFGTTPNAKGSVIPLFALGLLHIVVGISMISNNIERQKVYTVSYNANPEKFRQSEIKRTENFIKWYPTIRYISISFIIAGFLLFALAGIPVWKSIGLCIILLSFSLITIDYFSEERAHHYLRVLHIEGL